MSTTIDRDDVLVRLVHLVHAESRGEDMDRIDSLITAAKIVLNLDLEDDDAEDLLAIVARQIDAEEGNGEYGEFASEFRFMSAENNAADLAVRAALLVEDAA